MPVAKLQRNNINASKSEAYPGWVYACGDGAIGVCAISFGEKQMQKASTDLCYGIYDQVAGYSMSYSQYVNDEEWGWSGERYGGKPTEVSFCVAVRKTSAGVHSSS